MATEKQEGAQKDAIESLEGYAARTAHSRAGVDDGTNWLNEIRLRDCAIQTLIETGYFKNKEDALTAISILIGIHRGDAL